jgi:transcriptional regulator with XRE-family HTH domain
MDKDAKEARNRRIFEAWMACHTQEEIAEAVGCDQKTVSRLLEPFRQNGQMSEMPKTDVLAELAKIAVDDDQREGEDDDGDDAGTDGEGEIKITKARLAAAVHNDGTDEKGNPNYTPPIYNVWKQQTKSKGSTHFGNSEIRFLDNLLYLYTKPLANGI